MRHVGSSVVTHRLSGCGGWAQLLCGMRDLSPLQGRFLTTGPPGKLNIRLSLLISDIALKDKDYFKNNCNSTVIPKAMRNEPCCAKSLSPVQLFVTPWTVALQAPLSMGILQARILEWVSMPFSTVSSQPRDQTQVSHIAHRFLTR